MIRLLSTLIGSLFFGALLGLAPGFLASAQAESVITSSGTLVETTREGLVCADDAINYALEHGVAVDGGRVAVTQNHYVFETNRGSESMSRLSTRSIESEKLSDTKSEGAPGRRFDGLVFWIPVEGSKEQCYIVRMTPSCYVRAGDYRRSKWVAKCPDFAPADATINLR